MILHRPIRPLRIAALGFTLVEVMISLVVFAAGSAAIYETYLTSIYSVAENVSLNESNTNLQWAYYRMLSTLESAATFVDCATYDPTAQTFTAVTSGTWGNAVRFMQRCPITCYVEPDDGSGYSISNPPPPSTTTYLQSTDTAVTLSYNSSLYSASCIPSSARLLPTYPEVSGTVSSGSSPGEKPGLAISSINTATAGTITVHFSTALGSNNFLYCNRAYFIVESAFAVTTSATDGHKTLLYFPDTTQPSVFVTICQKMDGGNQTQPGDSTIPAGGTSGTFCIPTGAAYVQVLFPVRALEYLNVMSREGGSAARNNTWINVNCKFHKRSLL
jgi:prepilin-type N-terminal cleavage/methylation domain-containing protein